MNCEWNVQDASFHLNTHHYHVHCQETGSVMFDLDLIDPYNFAQAITPKLSMLAFPEFIWWLGNTWMCAGMFCVLVRPLKRIVPWWKWKWKKLLLGESESESETR